MEKFRTINILPAGDRFLSNLVLEKYSWILTKLNNYLLVCIRSPLCRTHQSCWASWGTAVILLFLLLLFIATNELSAPLRVTAARPWWASHTCFSRESKLNKMFVSDSLLHVFLFLSKNCTNISCLRIACVVGRLDRGQSAVVRIRSRLWAHTFLQVGGFADRIIQFSAISVKYF